MVGRSVGINKTLVNYIYNSTQVFYHSRLHKSDSQILDKANIMRIFTQIIL